jgi:sigma-54-interacting transcriptional regulator
MENPTKAFDGATAAAGPLDHVTQLSEDWRLARAAHADLLLMGMPRVNVLLVGTDRVVRGVVDSLMTDLVRPVTQWAPAMPFELPDPSRRGTLVLHHVGALPPEHQPQLADWIARSRGTCQVISTSRVSLLPNVESGTLLDVLYYRLNVVCLDLRS